MKKVLLLAYQFPPMVASGSMRPAGFCSYLGDHGFDVRVVSADPASRHPPAALDPSLMAFLDERVRIDRVDHLNWQKTLLDVRERFRRPGDAAAHAGSVPASEAEPAVDERRQSAVRRARNAVLNRLLLFPDEQKSWRGAVRRFARTLGPEERPDVVFATGNPWSALLAGVDVAADLSVPLVSDFRDPWVLNPKPPLSARLGAAAVRLEHEVVERSTRVIANTNALRSSFQSRYPELADRFVTITNGYHERILAAFDGMQPDSSSLDYFGAVYELRRPTALLSALKHLAASGELDLPRPAVRFIGRWEVSDRRCSALAEELESDGLIERTAPLDHAQYLKRLARSRYLLVLQQDFPLQIPAKIYEYIASGRPVFVVGGEGATTALVREHGLGVIAPDDEARIADALRTVFASDSAPVTIDPATRRAFGYRELTRRLAEELNAAVSEGTAASRE